ncbi:hypothetical protein GDO78_006250 [Eleutherodactylus coqui]|uniref:Uncharacterized protein n=1 Tax=Eleutherodactylus coqui TaxID=57060 RepID=A0A8J6FQD8_ELECQ|nr:hypothetical protein GDO78_006250 [Eleutherodactylus coqui]
MYVKASTNIGTKIHIPCKECKCMTILKHQVYIHIHRKGQSLICTSSSLHAQKYLWIHSRFVSSNGLCQFYSSTHNALLVRMLPTYGTYPVKYLRVYMTATN